MPSPERVALVLGLVASQRAWRALRVCRLTLWAALVVAAASFAFLVNIRILRALSRVRNRRVHIYEVE